MSRCSPAASSRSFPFHVRAGVAYDQGEWSGRVPDWVRAWHSIWRKIPLVGLETSEWGLLGQLAAILSRASMTAPSPRPQHLPGDAARRGDVIRGGRAYA